jgi:hypothetical protein
MINEPNLILGKSGDCQIRKILPEYIDNTQFPKMPAQNRGGNYSYLRHKY